MNSSFALYRRCIRESLSDEMEETVGPIVLCKLPENSISRKN